MAKKKKKRKINIPASVLGPVDGDDGEFILKKEIPGRVGFTEKEFDKFRNEGGLSEAEVRIIPRHGRKYYCLNDLLRAYDAWVDDLVRPVPHEI